MNTRRKFLLDCSTAVAGLGLLPIIPVSAAAMTSGDLPAPAQLSYSVLSGQVNTIFQVRHESRQTLRLKLLKARLARPTPATPGCRLPGDATNEKFSLIFSGPKDARLPSAIHQLEHERLGRLEMHLGQIGAPEEDDVRYEAVFNKPVAAEHRAALT